MSWQDAVLGASSVAFMLALIPAALHHELPPAKTSAITSFFLYVDAAVYFTLGLPFAGSTTLASSLLWTVIGARKMRRR